MDCLTSPATDFERAVAPHRAGLRAHCYRMLGSPADADDALQETLLRAWRALDGFEQRSSLRAWLYRIATNVCLRMLERRPPRTLPLDHGAAADPHAPLGGPAAESAWLEPFAASPEAGFEDRESVELAFVAALQHLPASQRAVLLLRDVLGFAPAEIAGILETSAAAVSSTLQRAHRAVEQRLPERSQQETLRALGDVRLRDLVRRYVAAWERADVDAIVALLAADAAYAMPPRPEWFRGADAVGAFLARVPLSAPGRWRRVPIRASAQLAFGVYGDCDVLGAASPHAIEVLDLAPDGSIAAVTSFQSPALFPAFGLPSPG